MISRGMRSRRDNAGDVHSLSRTISCRVSFCLFSGGEGSSFDILTLVLSLYVSRPQAAYTGAAGPNQPRDPGPSRYSSLTML
jgi:hypothetical protein